jgi:hypothetical protein
MPALPIYTGKNRKSFIWKASLPTHSSVSKRVNPNRLKPDGLEPVRFRRLGLF